MKLTVEQFAEAAAKVCTLRTIVEFARTGRACPSTMASWRFTEADFFEGLALAISIALSIDRDHA